MESTLYPKITNKLFGVRMAVVKLLDIHKFHPLLRNLDVVGTVKLHGAHADIVIDSEDNITFQSRNLTSISIEADNHGFAAAMSPRKQELRVLKTKLLARYQQINPDTVIDDACPLIIAGEYIGSKIQKGVAIAKLSPRFVIISIAINGTWQPDAEYADMHDEAAGIYNVSRGGFYRRTINLIDTEKSLAKLHVITAKVEKECPFAMTFGISGPGEGVVWKLEKYPHAPTTWFKIKPEEFPIASSKAVVPQEEVDKRKKLATFAKWVVRERRLEQGLEYLAEMQIPKTKQNVGQFLEWVVKDVCLEEKWTMKRDGIEPNALKPEINRIGAGWYYRSVNEDANAAATSAMEQMAIESRPAVKPEATIVSPTAIESETGIKHETAIKRETATKADVGNTSATASISEVSIVSKAAIIPETTVISTTTPVSETVHALVPTNTPNRKASESIPISDDANMSECSGITEGASLAAPAPYTIDSDSDDDEGGVPLPTFARPQISNSL